ncbi:MAG: type II secretion system minor pseudopilin GspK [Gammaproteobacteria bacterium]|nr:type II secretion system minor pseudopilin GspK [Gammaproteobacteria bacterium]
MALLTVLLVAALASVILVQLLSRHHLSVAYTRQALHSQQALGYALGAESWVRHLLYRDRIEDDRNPPVDSLDDDWAEPEAPFDLADGSIEIRVRDLEGLFNLNSIDGDPAAAERFRRLLAVLELDPVLTDLLLDWIDADEEVQGLGAEDGVYLLEDPPYRTANTAMASVTELRLLANMDAEQYDRLAPFVTALPAAAGLININTAPAPVLAALAPGMDPVQAGSYARPQTPWLLPGDLIGQEAGFAPEAGVMTTQSRLFEASILVRHGTQRLLLRTLIHRDPETGLTRVLRRSFGGRFEPDPHADLDERWPLEERR